MHRRSLLLIPCVRVAFVWVFRVGEHVPERLGPRPNRIGVHERHQAPRQGRQHFRSAGGKDFPHDESRTHMR